MSDNPPNLFVISQAAPHKPLSLPPTAVRIASLKTQRLILTFCVLTFFLLFTYQAVTNLRNGSNRTPLNVRIASKHTSLLLPSNVKVSIVSAWSEMALLREGYQWHFEKDQLRDAIDIVFDVPIDVSIKNLEATFTTDPVDASSVHARWMPMSIQQITDSRLLSPNSDNNLIRYQLVPENFCPSTIQRLIDKKSINWAGDVNLILRSLPYPLTFSLSLFLLLTGIAFGLSAYSDKAPKQTCPNPNNQIDRIHGLDHLRGIAICMVLAYHSLYAVFGYDQLGWKGNFPNLDHSYLFLILSPATFGYGGVAIFFAISGFCIHLSYSRSQDKSLSGFYKKRWFRIYPPYFASLVFFAFLFPTTWYAFDNPADFQKYYSQCFLVFNLTKETFWACNGVYWSVAVEWQLYIIYPFLLLLVQKLGWNLTLTAALLIEISVRSGLGLELLQIHWPNFSFALCNSATGYLFTWLIGAKLADDYLKKHPLFLHGVPLYAWFLFLILTLTFKPLSIFSYIAFSLLSVSLISRLLDGPFWTVAIPITLSRFLAFAGTISFSLYLFHQPLLNTSTRAINLFFENQPAQQITNLAGCLLSWAPIFLVSYLAYNFLELPSIKVGKTFIGREHQWK